VDATQGAREWDAFQRHRRADIALWRATAGGQRKNQQQPKQLRESAHTDSDRSDGRDRGRGTRRKQAKTTAVRRVPEAEPTTYAARNPYVRRLPGQSSAPRPPAPPRPGG